MNDLRQLLRLRTLRVQRAHERCVEAQAGVDRAAAAVCQRQREIERTRRAMVALRHAVVHALAPHLPRWTEVASAERERLADRLERAEYALIDDEQSLEQAQEALQRARAELTRALAREDAVRGLADEAQRTTRRMHEQRAELETEDAAARRRA